MILKNIEIIGGPNVYRHCTRNRKSKRVYKTKRYLQEVAQYGVNEAKWKSARDFCKKQNMEFMIITEKDLGI